MAIYHLSAKPVQRSKGQSVVAKMAYRAGEKLKDDRTGKTHDYRKKGKNGVLHTEIITPQGVTVPERNTLWNMAEQAEKRKDACLGKEYEFNLPHELDHQDRIAICDEMGEWLADEYSIAVDYAIHAPNKRGDQRNYHCHMMTTTRKITNDGLGEKADLEKAGRKRKDDLKAIRAKFADIVNSHLERKGLAERIDHRSNKDRGIDQTPTKKQGWLATQIEYKADEMNAKGLPSERSYIGDINRQIKDRNNRIKKLESLDKSRFNQVDNIKFNSYFEKASHADIVADIQNHAETAYHIKAKAETEKLTRADIEQYTYAKSFLNGIDDSRLEQKYHAEIAQEQARLEAQARAERQARLEAERQAQAELDQARLDNLADLAELQNSVLSEREQANFDRVLQSGDLDSIYQHDFKCRQVIATIEAMLHDDPYTPIPDDDLSQYRYAKGFIAVVDDMTDQRYREIANYLAEREQIIDINDDELQTIITAPEIVRSDESKPQLTPTPTPEPEPSPQQLKQAKLLALMQQNQERERQAKLEQQQAQLERQARLARRQAELEALKNKQSEPPLAPEPSVDGLRSDRVIEQPEPEPTQATPEPSIERLKMVSIDRLRYETRKGLEQIKAHIEAMPDLERQNKAIVDFNRVVSEQLEKQTQQNKGMDR